MAKVESHDAGLNDKPGFSTILHRPDYLRLWTGQVVSNVGTAISSLALLFFAYYLTQSALSMAILAMVRAAPVVLFSGFIGVYVDRWDRKKIMVASDATRTILILLIPLSIYLPSNVPIIYWVYLLTFLYASADAWFYPARNASLPNIVEGEELITANSLSQMTFQVVQLTIPPIGGVLIALLAPDYFLAFALNALTFSFSAILLKGIKTDLTPVKSIDQQESLRSQISAGAKLVASNSILSFLIVFAILLAVSSGVLNALMIPHIEGGIGLGEAEIGLMMGVGAGIGIVTALIIGKKSDMKRPLTLISLAGVVAGVSVIGFSLADGFLTVVLSWCLIASVDVMLNIPLMTLLQELVADEMRGRVFTLLSTAFTSFQIIGMGLGGVWAEAIGSTVIPILASGIGFLIVSLLAMTYLRKAHLHDKLHMMLSASISENENVARTTEIEISETLVVEK
ncbi:MAG: MFS transporter [Candidatus Thorarchaeota archaeon]